LFCGTMMFPYIGLQFYSALVLGPLIVIGLILIAGEYVKLLRFALKGNKDDCIKALATYLILVIYLFSISLLFPTNIIHPSGGIVNIIAHYFGIFFGLLSGNLLFEKHVNGQCYLVEVYGSLLNSEQRNKLISKGGMMEKIGDIRRNGWKISFDRCSKTWKGAVLNFVRTGSNEDIYYTEVYRADKKAFDEIAKREMGPKTFEKWRQREPIDNGSYRPEKLSSKFGETIAFLIPEKGRQPTPIDVEADYVNVVKEGIIESFRGKKRESDLEALRKAVEES